MVKITLQNFSGEIPRKSAHYLPDSNAVEASNAKLTGGSLRGMRDAAKVAELGAAAFSMYRRASGAWLSYPIGASFVPGPVAEDRLYVTPNPGINPLVITPTGQWDLPFERHAAAPTISVTGAVDNDLAEIVKYAFTFVSTLGEETAPSNLTVGVKFNEGRTVTLSGLPTDLVMNNRQITYKRIYRSQTSASGVTDLYYIGDVVSSGATFTDTWGARDIQEPCPTKHFRAAPTNIRGLTGMPNGMMAAFRGRELLFCEPYQPHAWPDAYRLYLDYEIVGLASIGTSLVVMTKGMPYIVQGLHPDSMAQSKVESILPCVSSASIVDLGASAIYASNDGLVQISESGAQLISSDLWSKDEWDAMTPSDIRAGRYGQNYIFSFQAATANYARQGYIISATDKQATLTRFNRWVRLFWNDPTTNELFCLDPNGVDVRKFDAPSEPIINYIWKSKPFRFVSPTAFSALLIEATDSARPADSGALNVIADEEHIVAIGNIPQGLNVPGEPQQITVTIPTVNFVSQNADSVLVTIGQAPTENFRVRIFGDGNVIQIIERGINRVQRVRSLKCREWQIEISGTTEVLRAMLAQSPSECWT